MYAPLKRPNTYNGMLKWDRIVYYIIDYFFTRVVVVQGDIINRWFNMMGPDEVIIAILIRCDDYLCEGFAPLPPVKQTRKLFCPYIVLSTCDL